MSDKKITLRDLAKRLDLSPTAVSKALRNAPDISPATCDKVAREAAAAGYLPNYWARAARSGKFNNITFVYVCPTLKGNYPDTTFDHEYLNGIEEIAAEAGLHLAISRIAKEGLSVTPEDLPKTFRERATDGMIVECEVNPVLEQALKDQDIPIVYLNSNVQKNEDCVYRDEKLAAKRATRYLLDLGFRKILYPVSAQSLSSPNFWVRDRLEGYREALAEADCPESLLIMPEPPRDPTPGCNLVLSAVRQAGEPVALLDSGVLLYSELLQKQIRIPADLSVLTLDMHYTSSRFFTRLDHLSMNRYELGRLAAAMLIAKINSGNEPQSSQCLVSEVSPRGSCAKVGR